jgi:hypothetical protein
MLGAAMYANIVRRHLHPFLEVGQQGHDAGSGSDGGSGDVGHVILVGRGRVGAVVAGSKRYASSSWGRSGSCSGSRGAHRVALGLLLGMAAGGLFLAVVVERHSAGDGLAWQWACSDVCGLLDRSLLRRGGRVVLGSARHVGGGDGGERGSVAIMQVGRVCLGATDHQPSQPLGT